MEIVLTRKNIDFFNACLTEYLVYAFNFRGKNAPLIIRITIFPL